LAGAGTGGLTVQRASGEGQFPERTVQKQMSETMGHDFSGVRMHTDPGADDLNQQLVAKAFTTSPDIFFKRGTYEPGSNGSGSREDRERESARGEPKGIAVSGLPLPIDGQSTVQRDWDVESVGRVFRGKEGEGLAKYGVKRGTYKLYKVDTLFWKEEKYASEKHWLEGEKPIKVVDHQAKAYHHRPTKEIGVSRDFDAKGAAATIVHEATHAGQREKAEAKVEAMASLVEREVEAHVNEEEFRIKHNMPPKTPEIKRNEEKEEEGIKEVMNRDSVRAFVEKKYGSLEQKIREVEEKGGSVGGRPFIVKVPKPIAKNFQNKERVA